MADADSARAYEMPLAFSCAGRSVPYNRLHHVTMKKITLLLALLATLCCCTKRGKFCITGCITGAADTMLYLEQLTLSKGAVAVDSVRLAEGGDFRFEGDTVSAPEFYRLRIGAQCINLAIDSSETVHVEACLDSMSFGYRVTGSGACDTIRLLCLKLADVERKARRIAADRNYTLQERNDMIDTLFLHYKADVKRRFIQDRYAASYSYYACFQSLGGQMLFNPMHSRSDLAWMRAVANAWSERYPTSLRTQNLLNIVQECKRNQAKPGEIVLQFDEKKIKELGIIDMGFTDISGRERRLSDLRGKVVLLDFTAFSLDGSRERTLLLRELYDKFHGRGFEIYQVSFDTSHHLWKLRTEALPWVSVYCEDGLESDMLKLYDVRHLPCYFLIDRNCDLQARQENIPDLASAIEALL